MSNSLTARNVFTVYNYANSASLSGYTLSISPFTFVLSSNNTTFVNQSLTDRTLWDFGDGTTATGLTATHVYDFPGSYIVTNYIYTSSGDVYLNTYSQTVTVFNFVTDALTLTAEILQDCLTTETVVCLATEEKNADGSTAVPEIIVVEPPGPSRYYLRANRIENPFTVFRTNSWQSWPALSSTGYSLLLYSSGGDKNYFTQKLDTNKYGHLYPYSAFYFKQSGEFVETKTMTTPSIALYCKLSSNDTETAIVYCGQSDAGSVFCGTSGSGDMYFKTDTETPAVLFYVTFNYNTFQDLYGYKYYPFINSHHGVGYLNTFGVGMSGQVLPNLEFKNFSITSTGLHGEGTNTTSFNIDKNKFVGVPINFVVRIKDIDDFSIKTMPLLSADGQSVLNHIKIDIVSRGIEGQPDTDVILTSKIGTFTDNIGNLSSLTMGGFYKGKFTPIASANNVCFRVKGKVGDVGPNGYIASYNLLSYSNVFNIYPSTGEYNIAKQNENIDFQETLKELRFQEILLDADVFFNDFLGTIYGNLSSDTFTMGKLAYEKIANFTSNKIDINHCDINSLYSYSEMLNLNLTEFNKFKFQIPTKIHRLLDLFSINYSRLRGTRNQYNLNFDKKSNYDTTKYGVNLGSLLDIATTVLTANDGYIIAKEKFSGDYVLCTTHVLTATLLANNTYNLINNTYPLSGYNENWGWGLETAGVSGQRVKEYYQFYTYRPGKVYYNNVEVIAGNTLVVSGAETTVYNVDYDNQTILLVTTDGTTATIIGDTQGFTWVYVENSYVNGGINYNDITNNFSYTLTSYNELVQDQGIIDNMLNYTLYKGLELFNKS